MTLADHQRINSSASNEWYTPAAVVEAARQAMGGIDLDPASCEAANRTVRAARYYTLEDDGLAQPWHGRVWLNPPYGRDRGGAAAWAARLIAEYRAGAVAQAVLLVNAATGNVWFKDLKAFPICFPDRRIRFYGPAGAAQSPTQSNALVYFGSNVDAFEAAFTPIGAVMARRAVWRNVA